MAGSSWYLIDMYRYIETQLYYCNLRRPVSFVERKRSERSTCCLSTEFSTVVVARDSL